ncbi:MAG: autotransporter-associated beta strand repeat-containing protein, partial [Verrucomicrobiales bacterium]|nr:autotransporter-associated beta strand repeat-containing protein [Verrucomicrobiales bacterium]
MDLTSDLRILGFNNGNISDLWNQQRNIQFAAGSDFMTYDGTTLRPLDDSEYFDPASGLINPTTTGATQNINLVGISTIVSENSTINSLRLGGLTDNNGTGATALVDHHAINLYVDGTLKISSGMISSAFWTAGNTSSAATNILGGAVDFDGKEAIINVQNAFYRLTDGTIQGGSLSLQSAVVNANGLTKTGFQQLILDGANSYSGVTTISEGTIFLRNGRSALGVGGTGNGVTILGGGNLNTGNGVVVGTAGAREDIYIGVLQGDQQIMRVDNDVTVWNSNLTIDNVDLAGQVLFTPRVRTDNSAVSIINGNITGGNTAVRSDVALNDSRVVQFDSAGNNVFIINGQIGDKLDSNGNAIPIADPISTLPTLAGVRTNANEVLRVTLAGGTDETNLILNQNYNAAGRLSINRGTLIANYDPVGAGGSGFWTAAAISKIPGADSITTAFNLNGGTVQEGFILGSTGNTFGAVMLARPGQVFNMATWQTLGTGVKHIGGLNESGIVTFGDGTGTLQNGDNGGTTGTGAIGNLYATDGGTVVFAQRMVGNIGTIANQVFGVLKQGRGTVELQNSSAGAGTSAFVLAGGTLIMNHTAATNVAIIGNTNARFDGGTVVVKASPSINTTEGFATANAASRFLQFSIGGNEIVAQTTNTGVARNMILSMGNANSGGTTATSNFLRSLGATANLVEDSTAGGTAQITLDFNASSTAAVKNQVIPWATYGTLGRTATDFAMSDVGAGNDVRAYGRAIDEYRNNVASWTAGIDVSENGGGGFAGSLVAPLTLSTLRFDANADSVVDLGTNVLTVSGNGLASSGGGLLVTTNVGAANKTITGSGAAALTTSGGTSELIIHHYSAGNLNIAVPITGTNALTVTGPSTTNAATIGTTGAVVLSANNTYTGRTFINGSVLSFSSNTQLGTNPGASTSNQITLNGGTLRFTGRGFVDMQNRGIQFDGNGGTIDVVEASGALRTDSIASNAQFRGDLIKVGAGTLIIEGTNALNSSFQGLVDVRQGTIRLNGDDTTTTTTFTSTLLGTNVGYLDGTILRNGTNLAIQMGNKNDANDWNFDEWITFEGNNYVTVGTINTQTGVTPAGFPNPNNERPVNLNGMNTINGTVTFDVVPGQTLRLNNSGTLMTTGNGDIVKDGQGAMQFQSNNAGFTGNITILQGRVYSVGQADPMGTGYLTGKIITLGSPDRQGDAQLSINSDSISGGTQELNHAVNVVYNPAQAKRIYFETFTNGSQIEVNGNITLNDNLSIYINDAAEVGGSQNYININSKLLDGTTTSGNILFTADDTGGANDNTNGRPYGYLVLKNDNSGWTGDIRLSTNTSYDQDQTAVLRLEHATALTAANDVDMGFNSMLQVGGGARTIGALSTNGGVGPFLGDTAGGTMGAQTNGTTVVIENAAATAGTLT